MIRSLLRPITRRFATMSNEDLNVLQAPLQKCSPPHGPTTGYLRDGFCRSVSSDHGAHTVAASLSADFLNFSKSRGNDLTGIPGMKPGCKWCLCVSRWKEAFDARGEHGNAIVPKVDLSATHYDALKKVKLEDFKQFDLNAAPPPQR